MDNGTDYDELSLTNRSTQTHKDEGTGIWATVGEFGPTETAVNVVLCLVCVATVISDSLALYVVYRGKKFPRFCRILSMNYLVSDMLGATNFVIHSVFINLLGYTYEIATKSRSSCTGIFVTTSSSFVAGISLERVMSLVNDLTHTVPSGTSRIAAIVTAMWGLNVGALLSSMLLKIGTDCQWGLVKCSVHDVFKVNWYVTLALLFVYDVILIITNLIIQKFVRRHRAEIMALQTSDIRVQQTYNNKRKMLSQEYEILKTIAKIVMSYLLLHIPITTTVVIHEWYWHMTDYLPVRLLKMTSYLCIQISSFVHLYYYVFTLKENKVNMYILLSRVFPRFKPRAELLRLELYNIPVVTDRATGSTPSSY